MFDLDAAERSVKDAEDAAANAKSVRELAINGKITDIMNKTRVFIEERKYPSLVHRVENVISIDAQEVGVLNVIATDPEYFQVSYLPGKTPVDPKAGSFANMAFGEERLAEIIVLWLRAAHG